MIQRIQTIYMLLVALLGIALYYWFPALLDESGVALFERSEPLFLGLIGISIALSIIAIFLYKNRKLKFVINRFNILANLILLGVFVYRSLSVPGETLVSEKGIGMYIPVISIVLLVLANRAIQRDEQLVKSVDRLR
jgi:ABC-type polysaccharide transport system permease subunit